MNDSETKIFISEQNQLAALYKKNVVEDLYIAHSSYQISSLYIGKVDKLVTNIKAAFIKLDKIEKNGFIHLEKLNWKKNNKEAIQTLNTNKKILVQIIKEPTSGKGPSVTTNIGVVGKYFIFLPFGIGINVSKKIYNQQEKNYLKSLITLIKPLSSGVLVKKEAQNQVEEDLIKDFLFIQKKWCSIQLRAKYAVGPSRLNANIFFIKKVIQRLYDLKTSHILVDNYKGAWKLYNVLKNFKEPYNANIVNIIYQKKKNLHF
jgi:ribonuclease E